MGVLEAVPSGIVDTSNPDTYIISYDATDSAGNEAITVTRTVNVIAGQVPHIELLGDELVVLEQGSYYSEMGAAVSDNVDQDITADVSGLIDFAYADPGVYIIRYNATDNSGRSAIEVTRKIVVVDRGLLINLLQAGEDGIDIEDIFRFVSVHGGLIGDHDLRAEEIRYLLSLIQPFYPLVPDA